MKISYFNFFNFFKINTSRDFRISQRSIFLCLFLLILIINLIPTKAQFKDISLSLGLNTTQIIGDNINKWPISPLDSASPFGGGMGGIQPSITAKLYIGLDEDGRISIPIGLDYTFYRTTIRIPGYYYNLYYSNKIDAPALTFGLCYSFFKMPASNVWFYGAFEGRTTFMQSGDYTYTKKQLNGIVDTMITVKNKVPAVRFGTDLRAGVLGQVIGNFFVNSGMGVGILNLLGKQNSRGDLFTIVGLPDSGKETTVYNFYLYFTLQLKL